MSGGRPRGFDAAATTGLCARPEGEGLAMAYGEVVGAGLRGSGRGGPNGKREGGDEGPAEGEAVRWGERGGRRGGHRGRQRGSGSDRRQRPGSSLQQMALSHWPVR